MFDSECGYNVKRIILSHSHSVLPNECFVCCCCSEWYDLIAARYHRKRLNKHLFSCTFLTFIYCYANFVRLLHCTNILSENSSIASQSGYKVNKSKQSRFQFGRLLNVPPKVSALSKTAGADYWPSERSALDLLIWPIVDIGHTARNHNINCECILS